MIQGIILIQLTTSAHISSESLIFYFILGGDPTGTGKGGVSIYGECFDDEIHDDLKHTGMFIYVTQISLFL